MELWFRRMLHLRSLRREPKISAGRHTESNETGQDTPPDRHGADTYRQNSSLAVTKIGTTYHCVVTKVVMIVN